MPTLTAPAELVGIKNGDHSFKVPARSGVKAQDVLGDAFDAVAAFVKRS
jgi:hypothetical protein